MKLKNKVVIITGGTKGIGLDVSKLFLKEGAIVVACSRNPKKNIKNCNFYTQKLDVSQASDCERAAKCIIKKFRKIDVLINNAGIMKDRLTENMSYSEFDSVIKTNLYGTYNMTKAVIPFMKKAKKGNIINVSSFVAKTGNFGQANYVASKSGIEGLTKCWAMEFARHGENIRVNTVAPGVVYTNIFKNTDLTIVNKFKEKSMLKRLTKSNEIANVMLFLASDDSSCITGSIIRADCGCRI